MDLNNDASVRVRIDTTTVDWVASPAPGVLRKMLQRQGDEHARATSVVRYAANARFTPHVHDLGEEFFVLEGTFADEHGRYPAGTYVRNPPGSSHAPFTDEGCTIFVKLRHFAAEDRARQVVDTGVGTWLPGPGRGIEVQPLGGFGTERATLVRWAAGSHLPVQERPGGEEIFVLHGAFSDEHGRYSEGCWLRLPECARYTPSSVEGCTFLSKTGHLGPSSRPPSGAQ